MTAARAPSILALVAACAGHSGGPRQRRPIVRSRPQPATVEAAAAPGTHAGLEEPHAGAIIEVEVTADGGAAISRDVRGDVRLWPALDGSREPVVVNLPPSRVLGIARRAGGEFDIAALDDAGGLAIAHVDGGGRRISRTAAAAEPAVAAFATSERGLLVQRVDATLELVDGDAQMRGRLAAEAGQRIVAITATGPRAAAVIEQVDGDRRVQRVREVVLAPQLAWGRWLSPVGDGGIELALSVTGERLALVQPSAIDPKPKRIRSRDFEIVVVDTASATEVARVSVTAAASPHFVDDTHLAVVSNAGLEWIALDLAPFDHVPAHVALAAPLTGGGASAVSAIGGDLVIATPSSTEYLGYGVVMPTLAAPGSDGTLALGSDNRFTLVDRDWHDAGVPPLPADPKDYLHALQHLEGKDWVALDGRGTLEFTGTPRETKDPAAGSQGRIAYEPSTHLIALVRTTSSSLYRYDPAAHRIDEVAKPPPTDRTLLFPVAPALANRSQLVLATVGPRLTLRWLRDAGKLDDASSSLDVDGTIAGVDAAGHVFVRERDRSQPGAKIGVYRDGAEVASLNDDGGSIVWPDPAGTRVVQIGRDKASLYSLDGTLRWSKPILRPGVAVWLPDGGLAIVGAAGAERVDPATGERISARCGWQFNRAAQRHVRNQQVEPLCAQTDP